MAWSASIRSAKRAATLLSALLLCVVAERPARAQDAGPPDAPLADAGPAPDAGDAGSADAAVAEPDAEPGAAEPDAAEPDAEVTPEVQRLALPPGGLPGVGKLPKGLGAVFVPALISGDIEPGWILSNDEYRESAPAGQALAVPPGHYTVIAGSGALAQKYHIPIEVHADELVRIKPAWGALVVHTIDADETPFRGPYLLFDLLTREPFGFGRGAQEEVGERVDAWLLKPSIYKLVGPLEDLDTVTNFATVEVRPGEVKHFVVVMDPTSGDFHGSGVVPTTDFTVRGSLLGHKAKMRSASAFKIRARIGGDISQSSSDNVLGVGGSSLGFGLFTDFSANYRWRKHLFNLLVDFKGGIRKNSGESFVRKVQDEVRVETIYIHQTWPRVGFYARLMAKSQVATTNLRFEDPTAVTIIGEEPMMVRKVRVAGTLDPTFMTESAGVNLRVIRHVYADLDARVGFSMRQTLTNGFLVAADDPDTDTMELQRSGGSFNVGGELVIAATTRFSQIASLHVDLDMFQTSSKIQVFGEATISVRVFGPMSIGILGALRKDDLTAERVGLSEAIFVRASKQVF